MIINVGRRMNKIIEKVKDFWRMNKIIEKVKDFFRNIKLGIPNLIKWIPVIWGDRDWDQYFLYIILKFKLEQMVKLQLKYGHSVNSEMYANQMKTCILLLDRIVKDDYLMNALKPHEKKWGESRLNFKPVPDNTELYEGIYTVEKVTNKKEKEQEDKERMRIYKNVDNLQKQDLDMLFKNMRKHIEGWWD